MCAERRLRSAEASALLVAKEPNLLQVDSEYTDQTGRMHRLIWIFAERTGHLLKANLDMDLE